MVKACCLKECKSESHPGSAISFHSFPSDKALRAKWIEAIGFEPKTKYPTICSLHFRKVDFKPLTLPPRLFDYAVPYVVKAAETPAELKFCRICLTMDVKMHDMKNLDLREMYQNITGVEIDADSDSILQCLCWECAARLTTASTLREKALISDGLLNDLMEIRESKITRKDIEYIKKNYTSLDSSLLIDKVFITTEIYEYQQPVILKEVEIRNNNYKESKNKRNNRHSDDTQTDKSNIKNKRRNRKRKVVQNLHDDNNEEIIYDCEEKKNIEENNTNIQQFESVKTVSNKKTTHVLAVNGNGKIVLVNRIAKKLVLDENDGLFKVLDTSEIPKKGMINNNIEGTNSTDSSNTAEQDKSIARVDEDQEVQTTSLAQTKNNIFKKAGSNTAPATEDIQLKRRLRHKSTDMVPLPDDSLTSLFTITPLTREQQIEEVTKRQESEKYINAPYKCTVCYRGYRVKERYTAHLQRHNEQNGVFKCVICKIRKKSRRVLQNHIYAQHTAEFNCKKCAFITRFRGVAQKHVQFHAGTIYECPHCGIVFDQYTTYMGHLRKKHVSDFVCELCGFTFVSKKGVDVHKQRRHRFSDEMVTLEGPYCEVCDVKFASEEAHDRHLRLSSKHISEHDPSRLSNDSQTLKAQRNGKVFRRAERRPPMKPRKPSNPYKTYAPVSCEQCGIQLHNLALYAQHFRRAHPEKNRTKYAMKTPCMCEQCGSIFHTMSLLREHMWVHTGEKTFKCDQCPKSYTKNLNLMFHKRRVHSGTRPSFECPVCGKHFAFYSNRRKHMFIHTGLKPFKCELCDKCFNTTTSLKAHIEHVHFKKPWPKRTRPRGKGSKCDDLSEED